MKQTLFESIVFAFSQWETKISYETLLDIVQTHLTFSFSGTILESVQGKALQTYCKNSAVKQTLCLSYFHASLNNNWWTCESEFNKITKINNIL